MKITQVQVSLPGGLVGADVVNFENHVLWIGGVGGVTLSTRTDGQRVCGHQFIDHAAAVDWVLSIQDNVAIEKLIKKIQNLNEE